MNFLLILVKYAIEILKHTFSNVIIFVVLNFNVGENPLFFSISGVDYI
nr:hypothetical protein [Salicibibacter kimchii]